MAKTYSRVDIDSDHNSLVAEFRVQWKRLNTYGRRKISEPEVRTQVMNLISNALLDVKDSSEVDEQIGRIKLKLQKQ